MSGQQVEVEAGQNVVPIHGHPRRSPVPAVLSPVVGDGARRAALVAVVVVLIDAGAVVVVLALLALSW